MWLLLLLIAESSASDTLEAFNCEVPTETKFIAHNDCHASPGHVNTEKFTILQYNRITNVTGYVCSAEETILVGYCGAYSHTKETAESTYHTPKAITMEECRRMVTDKAYSYDSKSYPIKVNTVNLISVFTHGSITYTGANIDCTGQALRLKNGKINSNMVRQAQIQVKVTVARLINDDNDIILPARQVVIGKASVGHGKIDTATVIWEPQDDHKCQLALVSTMNMETIDHKTYYNKDSMIQLRIGGEYFDSKCKIKVIKTNLEDIYLTKPTRTTLLRLPKIDPRSLDIASHYETQLRFLSSEIVRSLRRSYSTATSPDCGFITLDTPMATTRVSGNTFSRNIGDVSVKFTCTQTIVFPANTTQGCYKQLPVTDEQGHHWFLDSATRILLKQGSRTICMPSLVPVYLNTAGDYVTYTPKRTKVITSPVDKNDPQPEVPTQSGLYPHEAVSAWLNNAFLQHFSEVSYALLYENGCYRTTCGNMANNDLTDFLGESYNKLASMEIPNLTLGLDLEKIGGRCSIAVCIMVLLFTIYYVATWTVRFLLLHDNESTILTIVLRACFPSMFLISTVASKNTVTP